jgi:hypothetical protein
MSAIVVIDPAGMRRQDTDERSSYELLKSERFVVKPAAPTNQLVPRIAAVEHFLTRIVDGKAVTQIDPVSADLLVKALAGKYRYKIKTNGDAEDKPDKSHPWSDVADAFQYMCLYADGGATIGRPTAPARQEVKPAPYKWAV